LDQIDAEGDAIRSQFVGEAFVVKGRARATALALAQPEDRTLTLAGVGAFFGVFQECDLVIGGLRRMSESCHASHATLGSALVMCANKISRREAISTQ
jgi:hypothetical protein